jgi:serine/threonine protein kinase
MDYGLSGERFHVLALPVGSLLANQFSMERPLGQPGGFGIVYLARDLRLDIQVAVKEFLPRELAGRGTDQTTVLPHSASDAELFDFGLRQFLAEARILARIRHPSIVQVRTFFEENGTAYLVMDYYEGETLDVHLRRQGGHIPSADAVQIMMPILEGLSVVHRMSILHRDIKPANIYLTGDGRPLLLDFGAARQAVGEKSRSLHAVLTPGFAPVEQYGSQGTGQGPWTDIYGCAATLYAMVTGLKPPDAPERFAGADPLQAPSRLIAGFDPRLEQALMKGLAVDYRDRTQSAEEFAGLLCAPAPREPVQQPSRPPASLRGRPAPARTRPSKGARGKVSIGVGIVAVVAVAAALGVWVGGVGGSSALQSVGSQPRLESEAPTTIPAESNSPEPQAAELPAPSRSRPIADRTPPLPRTSPSAPVAAVANPNPNDPEGEPARPVPITRPSEPTPPANPPATAAPPPPPVPTVQAVRDDLGIGRMHADRGEYVQALDALTRAGTAIDALLASSATDELRILRLEAGVLIRRTRTACWAEVQLAERLGTPPPRCD